MANRVIEKKMITSNVLFCSLSAAYLATTGYLYKLIKEKSNKEELDSLKKELVADVDKIRDSIQQIYGATKENKATLTANRDTLRLILERLPAK